MQPDLRFPQQIERIESQLRTAEECRSRLAQIQQQLVDLAEDKKRQDQERQQLAAQQLETRLQQVRQHAEQHLDTLRLDAQTRTVSLENSYKQNHRSLQIRVEEGLAELQERRESETWILQSVFDEDTQDSPVKEFERAADSYVSQKQLLDGRIEMLNQQIDSTGKYLRRCHAGMEAELPPPKVANKNIEAAQQNCVEQGDALVEVANNIARLHLPSLTAGARLWGFGILCALVLCVPIIAIKVPPQHLIDPQMHNPDFQWVGVATLIAFVSAGIIGLILMLMVQSKLRSRFEAMLQHASNATASRNQWDSRSQKKLNRLDKAAEKWRTELEATRTRKQQLIQQEISGT